MCANSLGRGAALFRNCQLSRQAMNSQRERNPGESVDDEINSDIKAKEPETRGLKTPHEHGAHYERYDSTDKVPTPVGKPHDHGRNRPVNSGPDPYRTDHQSNG